MTDFDMVNLELAVTSLERYSKTVDIDKQKELIDLADKLREVIINA